MNTNCDKSLKNLSVTERDRSIVIRFTRVEKKCPLSVETLNELDRVIEQISSHDKNHKIIFTGTENVFASGANLNEIGSLGSDTAREFALRGQNLFRKISELKQTTIAAINGICFGGALDLALVCDVRIAARGATFCHPGVSLGIITGWGGTQRLTRLIGESRTMQMFLTAEPITAEFALGFGLIDEIVDEVIERAAKLTS